MSCLRFRPKLDTRSHIVTVGILVQASSGVSVAIMPCSRLLLAKRALVSALLELAAAYRVATDVSRESEDKAVLKAYRRVVLKAHPDKGGDTRKFQSLQVAKDEWDSAREASKPRGRPKETPTTIATRAPPKGHRIRGVSVLLTYFGKWSLGLWQSFLLFVRGHLASWSVLHWCATLEKSAAGKLHVHVSFQFRVPVDRTSAYFVWNGRHPNASANDYLEQGVCKNPRYLQASIDRGFFYVYADKDGTQRDESGSLCVAGNRVPCWDQGIQHCTHYQVPGKWPQTLWQQHKLSHQTYEQYLFLCRDGVISRKRNLDAVRVKEEELAEDAERWTTTKRVRAKTFDPFPEVPAVTAWRKVFAEELDRYPFLVLLGPSRSRKTEFAKSLFKNPLELKIGTLQNFPDEMRSFSRQVHDAVVLDDCRDFLFLIEHQEKLQGKVDAKLEFASTPGGQCKYTKWLWRVPLVITANFTTKNRHLLESDDFLGNSDNRVVVERSVSEVSS